MKTAIGIIGFIIILIVALLLRKFLKRLAEFEEEIRRRNGDEF